MLGNYLTTALNVLLQNRVYSIINIFGLAVGMAACLLIVIFIRDEFAQDSFWPNAENIYRVQTTYDVPGRDPLVTIRAGAKYKHWMDKDLVGAEAVGRLRRLESVVTRNGEVFSDFVSFIDPEFLEIFALETIAGEYQSAMGDAAALVVTESFAAKYFGNEPAVGGVLTLSVYQLVRDYKVVAVVADPPRNSQFIWRAFAFVNEADFANQPWEYSSDYNLNNLTFVKTQPGVTGDSIAAQMPTILDNNSPPILVNGQHILPSNSVTVRCVNIADNHLRGGSDWGTQPAGDIRLVYGLSAIGLLITLIAAINFINLTTARSTRRAREVSLRKVVGASRRQIVIQYVGESVLLCLLSLVCALAITSVLLPWFNSFTGKELSLLSSGITLGAGFALALMLGVFGGIYPAFYISRFQPATVLRANKSSDTTGSSRLRAALVVVQFAISIGLVICTAVIYSQTTYARNVDLGYHKQGMLIVYDLWNYNVQPHVETLLNEVERIPGVLSVGRSNRTPGPTQGFAVVTVPGEAYDDFRYVTDFHVDENYLATYGIRTVTGRDFDRNRTTDTIPRNLDSLPEQARVASVILNQAALDLLQFGTPVEALGRQISLSMSPKNVGPPHVLLTVVGTAPDVHFATLREPIAPAMYVLNDNSEDLGAMTVRFDPRMAGELPDRLQSIWKQLIPGTPMKYQFMDEMWDAQYANDERQAETLAVFSVLAVIIACLGLFGLSSFTAELRTKEIGIRKVMGAKTQNIVQLLVMEFTKPILLANIIAWPIAWYAMSEWLKQYHYRIDLTPTHFLIPTVVALIIAWVTLVVHVYRVASARPIAALRYE